MYEENLSVDENLKNEEEQMEGQQDDMKTQNGNEEIESPHLEEIKVLNEKLEEIEQRHLRLQADFDNYKKRISKEKEDIYKHATEGMVENLLPVIDNFERALASFKESKNETENQSYLQGIEMVYQQFIQALSNEGVEEISALGETFDPNIHHAVAQESNEEFEDQCILEVFQKGYTLKNKVIRPSMVKVCIHS